MSGEVPITRSEASQAQAFLRKGELIAIGGIIETNKVSIFSEIDRLDRIPGGGYFNKLITYPKRKTRSELVLLMRPTVLPTPDVAALRSKDSMPRTRPTEPEVP
jgi:type II secretory pathway component GspD/PulD (secretin)